MEIAHHMELSLYKLCYDVTQFSHRPVGLRHFYLSAILAVCASLLGFHLAMSP